MFPEGLERWANVTLISGSGRNYGIMRIPTLHASIAKGGNVAAMKPRTGDGPMEVVKEGRVIVMRVPLEGGGRLVVALTPDETRELGVQIAGVVAALPV